MKRVVERIIFLRRRKSSMWQVVERVFDVAGGFFFATTAKKVFDVAGGYRGLFFPTTAKKVFDVAGGDPFFRRRRRKSWMWQVETLRGLGRALCRRSGATTCILNSVRSVWIRRS